MTRQKYAYFHSFEDAYEWSQTRKSVHGIQRAKFRDYYDLNWIVIYEDEKL